ncbi:MAG: outer membrane protein, partial [Myxococcaceae bacterium]|nr:outer membrane protein [Myxococcaceae bacterium]
WAPTGQHAQWATDGVWRVRPRALVAGDIGHFVYAAQLGIAYRERSELGLSAAAGVRFIDRIVVGPEVFAATATGDGSTAIEALLGAHFLIDAGRVGAGVGRGFGGLGSPAARVLLTFEWSAEAAALHVPVREPVPVHEPPDTDHDRVPDVRDACPKIMGIATPEDPRTNGCPPDTDGDGIDDLEDACPTLAGPRTSDARTSGCPDS